MGSALRNRSPGAVFLGYHSVARRGPPFLSIEPDLFERQLFALRRDGFRSGGERELAELAEGRRLPGRHVFLTFDDGYLDNFTEALPLLIAYGFRSLSFVLPPKLDLAGSLDWPEVSGEHREHPEIMRSMNWSMVEEMAAAGMEFGSHTLRHRRLTSLGDEELANELLESRRQISDRLGGCRSLAYPFGDWDGRVAAAAAGAGYSFAFTLPFGSQWRATPLSIPRVAVDQRDVVRRFRLKLRPSGRRLLLSPAKVALRRARRPRSTR